MSNPSTWMPYYGSDFEQDTKGWSRAQRWSYLAAVWHFWSVKKGKGIPNEESQMMGICDCPAHEWGITKPLIFCGKPYFYLENGFWFQDRAKEEFDRAAELCIKRDAASKKGLAERAKLGQIKPLIEPQVEPTVQPPVEPTVPTGDSSSHVSARLTPPPPPPQPPLQPESPPKKEVATPPAGAVPPKKERTPAQKESDRKFNFCEGVKTLWVARFKSVFQGREYQITSPDKSHLADFAATTTKTPSEIVNLAARAWVKRNTKNFSHCENSLSISYVCRHYNEIEHELGAATPVAGVNRNQPTREKVYEYAKEKGDTKGFAITFYDRWAARNFMKNGFPLDWQIQFSEEFSKSR